MSKEVGELPHKSSLVFHLSPEQNSTPCIALTQGKEGSQAACWEQLLIHGEDPGRMTPFMHS